MKQVKCFILVIILVFTSIVLQAPITAFSDTVYGRYGDANGDGNVTAGDALLVLQHSVKKITLSNEAQRYVDVDGSGAVNASDALLVLQYSVNKIIKFEGDPTPYTEEEYTAMLKTLSYETPSGEVSDAYEIAPDGGMIYNPLSREAGKNGTLHKYDGAAKKTGTLSLDDGTAIEYAMPASFTAYDMVPITYTVKPGSGYDPVYFEATAAEESARKKGSGYYDAILPNKVDIQFEYLGHVSGTKNTTNRPYNSPDFSSDITGIKYPQYDTTALRRSGSVERATYTWFRFKYTNVGDTILDSDGGGTFCFEPILQRRNNDTSDYSQYLIPANIYYRITDTLYPGESGEVDILFNWDRIGAGGAVPFRTGDYRIELRSLIRNETSNPENYFITIWGGHTYSTSYLYFTVDNDIVNTPPSDMTKTAKKTPVRNTWLHTYEEFMTSYDAYLKPSLADGGEAHTMYLQCAPWTDSVTLKLMSGSKSNLKSVEIPVKVETDSIKVKINTKAQNYIIKDDGTRYPAMATQSMADMRVNISSGPDAATELLNELLDMKESGINIVTTTAAFETDMAGRGAAADTTDANWFMADALRQLGMKMEGYITYPYLTSNNITKARWLTKNSYFSATTVIDGFANSVLSKACGVKALYQFMRWGDNYYVNGKGNVIITAEDSRGWMRVDIDNRETLGEQTKINFREWLKKKYGTIEKLNLDWNRKYASFEAIDPEAGTVLDHNDPSYIVATADFYEWQKAVNNLDVYRTIERTDNYREILGEVSDTFNAAIGIRTEGGNWTSKVPYNTDNQHYRHVYYSQRRCAIIPEVLNASRFVKIHSDYTTLPYTKSEVSYLTNSSVSMGITPMHLVQFDRLRDIAVNPKYGKDYSVIYNIGGLNTKGVFISTTRSLFEWYKATYEAGGIPGILWEDYLCDGFATQTQIREMKFYSQKIAEAMKSAEAKEWANSETVDAKAAVEKSNGVYSYKSQYMADLIQDRIDSRKK